MLKPTYETINLHALRCRPAYKLPPTYQVSDSMGAGCFLDAPGYPTYFLRHIYTKHGNDPRNGAQLVIRHPEDGSLRIIEHSNDWRSTDTWESYRERISKRVHKLWIPLPLDHPRVQAWIDYVRKYFHNCYIDPRKGSRKVEDLKIGLWSIREYPAVVDALGIEIDQKVRDVCNGDIEQYSQDELKDVSTKLLALSDTVLAQTDRATDYIKEFYPEYQYEPTRPYVDTGNWWELLPTKPTPEECPGETWGWGITASARHPVNGKWCQVCGWHEAE